MIRVSDTIRCPVCGRGENQGCMVSPDGKVALCVRTPSNHLTRNGWIHKVNIPRMDTKEYRRKKTVPPLNWIKLTELYRNKGYSEEFGCLGAGYDGETHYIPMFNQRWEIVGIQRVFNDRSKATVSGSRMGIFKPAYQQKDYRLLITEGASDTVVAHRMNYRTYGRPSCGCGNDIVTQLVQSEHPEFVGIIADHDDPGIKGAQQLSKALLDVGIRSSIIIPPKEKEDLKDWVRRVGVIPVRDYISNVLRG